MSNFQNMKVSAVALAGILAFLSPFSFAQPQQKESANTWEQAEAKIEAYLKKNPKMHSVELKSERLKKHLPEFRVFVRFDWDKVERSELVLVNQAAEITDLGDATWQGEDGAKYFRAPQLTKFLSERGVQVKSQEDAVDFIKLFDGLQGAPSNVASMRINAKDLAAFDKKAVEIEHPNGHWKYTSVKREGGWKVMVQYVGDPSVSIMMPPTYEVDCDEKGNFRDLRRYDALAR